MYEKKIPKDFSCGFSVLMEIIGGKWKSYLLYLIHNGVHRPNELHKQMPSATRRVLNMQLRELEFHGMVKRVIYPELPPRVEYFLTEFGDSLLPVIFEMNEWGNNHLERFQKLITDKQLEAVA
ncbi:DNA-binding HxlR family transcriptional regulator [Chitinophaga dinghuensis]|uniref:DNA-binding HxlR family transcriptional regulator n=1 Tax=Chitinophaga dinghuensis TaxID=1539050 RepID=A0A327W1T9_9BACT|nr:helix-turn-helix domain-containing protein [Chitinophaga dinghuensis]RAJ82246.1 DNA-binding HxlR family transcriptional regulator [Chitinophaga dinghuensis]